MKTPDSDAVLAVVKEVARELHPSMLPEVTLDSSLDRELGFDSLGRVELLGRIEREFEVGLPESVLASAETPRDLVRALGAAGGPAAADAATEVAEVERDASGAAPTGARTLVEVLDWHVQRHPERRHILYLASEGPALELSYGELWRRGAAVAAGLQRAGVEHGQSVGIMLPSGLDYFAAFYGALLAGAVPVPMYPPTRPSQIEDHLRRQAGILDTAQVRVLVTFDRVKPLARLLKAQVATLREVTTLETLETGGEIAAVPAVGELDTAFLQFTSGSTSDPKGVILTHDNLLSNLRAIGRGVRLDGATDTIVSWLPLYHDMGLIGAWMGSLYFATPLILMSPLTFLARPARWLKAVDRYRGTHSAAPNFAYELCLKKIDDEELEGVDLSSWRASLNGAEPVSPATIRRFNERFARFGFSPGALMPVYGLAECSLAVAFPPEGRPPAIDRVDREALATRGVAEPADPDDETALEFVSCGMPLLGHEVRIVDGTGEEVGERHEGTLEFRGPSATSGYFRNPEATKKLFHDGWLDSGDRAYIAEGELYLTGRVKDMIIRAGRNIYPQELEEAVGNLDGVRKGCVAVFASTDPESGTERLVVLAETRDSDDDEKNARLSAAIQEVAVELVGTPADDVVLAKPHTVPKTSSGKIRRAAGRDLYEGKTSAGRGPVWWQVGRLALAGAKPQIRKTARAARDLARAGRFWGVIAAVALPVGLGVVLAPKLKRRRRLAKSAARRIAQLASIPIRVEGGEHLEGLDGSAVVAANHASYLDGFALTASLEKQTAFLAKKEITDSFLARVLLERLGTLFVERFDPNRGVEDIAKAVEAIRGGESLLFFPEGTFDRAPGLRPFRLGAFFVAAQAGVPVVPVAIRGTRSVLRGDEWFPRPGAVTVTICPPVRPEGDDLKAAAALRDRVRAEILRHCGEPDLLPREGLDSTPRGVSAPDDG